MIGVDGNRRARRQSSVANVAIATGAPEGVLSHIRGTKFPRSDGVGGS